MYIDIHISFIVYTIRLMIKLTSDQRYYTYNEFKRTEIFLERKESERESLQKEAEASGLKS